MYKILIGIPTRGRVTVPLAQFLQKQKYDICYATSEISVSCARIEICRYFLNRDYTHLFMVDDDIWLEKDAIDKLLSHDKDVIIVGCLINQGKIALNAYKKDFEQCLVGTSGLSEIDVGGLGACLVKKDVIRSLNLHTCFAIKHDKDLKLAFGEDYTFCKSVKELGYKIYCDFDIKSDHLKVCSLKEMWGMIV